MPTVFIAVRCFQCSTMQVKQQKRSSNKWNCVVCNEKQSVRKVFAQGFMAKDVRKFVQNFNMSRQLSEQNLHEEFQEGKCGGVDEEIGHGGKKKRRTDWSEYIDDDDKDCRIIENNGSNEGDGLEPAIVTEMPKALFRKPKLKNYSDRRGNREKLLRPEFNSTKKENMPYSQDTLSNKSPRRMNNLIVRRPGISLVGDSMKFQETSRASKWNDFRAQLQDDNIKRFAVKEPISKWNSYMTNEDDDDLVTQGDINISSSYAACQWNSDQFQTLLNDQRVEDDIHPDFL